MRTPSALYKCTVYKQSAQEITQVKGKSEGFGPKPQKTEEPFVWRRSHRILIRMTSKAFKIFTELTNSSPLFHLWFAGPLTVVPLAISVATEFYTQAWPQYVVRGSTAHMRASRPELPADKTWSAQENRQAEQSRQSTHTHIHSHVHCVSVAQIGHIEAFTIIPHSL